MKKILHKLFMGVAVIAFIPGLLAWIAGMASFFLRLFIWNKTGEWRRLVIIEGLPDSWIVKLKANGPEIQKILFWILNREIISSLLGFSLILMLIFLILKTAARRREKKTRDQSDSKQILCRIKNLRTNV